MAVFRIERTRDYTVMSNHHLRNANLSLKAKGLLSMMLSLPEDWNYTTRGLAKICKEGVDAIGAALRELEGAGYKTIPNDNPETVRCGYVLNSHPAVLDGFIDLVREEQQLSRTQGEKIQPSRPSVRDKLKQELPAHKPAAPKKREPER